MRDFNDKDRKKKASRIELGENPAGLEPEKLALVEASVKTALKDGYLSCPSGWEIARRLGVPRIAVGAVVDRLGVRVTDCQLGFFTVDKSPCRAAPGQEPFSQIEVALKERDGEGKLTCAAAHELAGRFNITPLEVSETAGTLGLKIRHCQLGCF